RVASLTDLIANKLNESRQGHYKDLRFSDIELKELSMAGWMHDVGKIITPEFIMDKSVKLETIFDRIELVKERFRTMKLLLSIKQNQMPDEDYSKLVQTTFGAELEPGNVNDFLDEEFAFVERINFGGEFLHDADAARIDQLAKISLPHEGHDYILIDEDELHNLQIRRGTLLPEEIKEMSSHVQVTWEMLSQLSFPKKYKNVAFYAATHHEKLNGKGYPWGLKAEELPIQSRIIAVADIFEALTSADRPYKKPKKLSESLKIMAFCVKDGDLDPDLLDFFLDSGLYMDFATQNMYQEYVDTVDIEALKKIYHPSS
ncbi:MAG: HD domain-containing phosphohydrolase, partial [Candidatus Cloacimonadaceae bacterium]|nr:HD domain-containing phosphohydrolase [Candidatus Cloacimonadaceae bacterium]